MKDEILYRNIIIDKLYSKRYILSNDINRIRKHNSKFKMSLEQCRNNRNKTNIWLEGRSNMILCMFDINYEIWCWEKINSANCRRLMKSHEQIIGKIALIFIDTNEVIVFDDDIIMITNR